MLLSPGSAEKVSKIRVKNREPVPSYRMDRNDDEIDAMMSDGEGDSSDNLDRDDSSDDGDLDDGVGNDQLKRQDGGDMDQEMQVHQALLRQAEAAAHMQTLMQSQLGLSGFPNLSNFPGLPGMAGLGGLHPDLQAQLQAHIQALSGGGQAQTTGNGTSNGHGSSSGNESQSPPAGMGPPKTSSPLNNASQNSLLSLANSSHHSLTTPASSPYNKQRHHSNNAISPRRGGNGQHHSSKDSKDDDQDSMDGSSSPSPPASMLASIAAAASALRSPSGGLLPPSSAASHPYLASAFSSALGGLSALTSGLSVGGGNGAHGSAGGQHPPLTPSPSSDSPQQTDAPRAPNSSQQSWTFEEQFKQLYELNDDAGRKAFLDELFDFMQKRGTPITRLPIMAKQVLDLYELYNLVVARGGLVDVINKKLWQEIIKGLHLPSSITSAAFTLRTQYMKYLYPYECEKEKYSSPNELQAAIDGNRREGRRSSYGAYADLVPRGNGGGGGSNGGGGGGGGGGGNVSGAAQHAASLSALASHMSHMSPLSLVSRPSALNGNGHHRPGSDSPPSQSPHEALAELNMSRIHLWNIYNSLGGDVGGDMAAAMAAASRFLPQTAATAGTGSSGSQPPQTEALNLAAEQHAAAQAAAAAAAARALELNKENNKEKDRESGGHKSRRERKEEEREKRDRDRSYDLHEDRSQSSIRIKEESLMQDGPPASKRLLLDDDVSLNMRMTPIGLPGANIKITSRGDGRTNDSSLVVSMEINGIVYQGVLFAQAAAAAAAAAALTPARGRLA